MTIGHDSGADWGWRVAIFLAGVTMTLIGSFFANGASKGDIADAMKANNQVVSLQLQTLSDSQKSILIKMEKLETQVQRMNVAVGADVDDGVTIRTYPRRQK